MHAKNFVCCGGFPLDLKMINRHFKMLTYGDGSGRNKKRAESFIPLHIKTMSSQVRWGRVGKLSLQSLRRKIHSASATGLFFSIKISFKTFRLFLWSEGEFYYTLVCLSLFMSLLFDLRFKWETIGWSLRLGNAIYVRGSLCKAWGSHFTIHEHSDDLKVT